MSAIRVNAMARAHVINRKHRKPMVRPASWLRNAFPVSASMAFVATRRVRERATRARRRKKVAGRMGHADPSNTIPTRTMNVREARVRAAANVNSTMV
jgi:hypothetical protein